jgi:hypothetical protein
VNPELTGVVSVTELDGLNLCDSNLGYIFRAVQSHDGEDATTYQQDRYSDR